MDRERAVERDGAFRSSQIKYARWLENLRENPVHLRRGQILNDCGLDLARIARGHEHLCSHVLGQVCAFEDRDMSLVSSWSHRGT